MQTAGVKRWVNGTLATDECNDSMDCDSSEHPAKRQAQGSYSLEEVNAMIRTHVKEALLRSQNPSERHELLRETFTPNDPVHGLLHLPGIVRMVVDTAVFQRMRHIKQLAVCDRVYPGATHNRFFHSIGCAHLAHEMCRSLQNRQPGLEMTDRDMLCVLLAALCHDLGHPCYSHMFEEFVHKIGRNKRRAAESMAQTRGEASQSLPQDVEADICRYERFSHEIMSIHLVNELFVELEKPLRDVGLRQDHEGDDFACIIELIDPPKQKLEQASDKGSLREEWPDIIKGRPVGKAWMYEIVSNWRSGVDVDKFDYFRRDAFHLGIHRQYDHDRYMKAVKVIQLDDVPTLSPPFKDKDMIRENVLELRKMLHRVAYQHKTVKKLQAHMIDILILADKAIKIKGKLGKMVSMSQAAVEMDVVAYVKMTDTFIEAKLLAPEDPSLDAAAAEYDRRITRREMMRLVGDWDLPRVGEEGVPFAAGPLPLPEPETVISEVHALYNLYAQSLMPDSPVRAVPTDELRCEVAAFHYGMKQRDPITRLLFHTKKDETRAILADNDAKPLRQKIFVFWNPTGESENVTLKRLTLAFDCWAQQQVEQHQTRSSTGLVCPKEPATNSASLSSVPPAAKMPGARRSLKIQASCPLTMADGLAGLLGKMSVANSP
eukprot:TRINITY_DN15854_c0_g1_i1.p1 TRINITY_DN15854_c0_g1~~TRINITY_DN15854_c0_g1_i1.p1  ORF type:complete len:684 (+),score=108.50 TRINITY_DN15854_c0_g1_i1:78-2054(+)